MAVRAESLSHNIEAREIEDFLELKECKRELTGAHILLSCLREEGVDTIFGLPGGVILSIYDAITDYPIQHVLVRHEQGATHMAEGYARSTGKPGVVLVTSGPGATNAVTGLANAYYDSVPLIVFTGNVPTTSLGNDAFQEADIVGITRPCTKHNILVRSAQDLAGAIREAFHVATTGRPGPVLVDLPKDVLVGSAEFNYSEVTPNLPGYKATEESYSDETIDEILELLRESRQPVILSGGGVVIGNANNELLEFAERFNIPVACTLMGLGGFPANHPLYIGFSGMHGRYWANLAIANADLLIVAGSRLSDRQTGRTDSFAKNARIVHIDLDATTLDKNVKSYLPVQGEVRGVLKRLLEKTKENMPSFRESLGSSSEWFEKISEWKRNKNQKRPLPEGFLSPGHVIERLFHWLPEDGFVTTEVGQHQMWAAQMFNLSRARSFITSGGLGTMGFGFPAALGVQIAFPSHTVVDIAGDGSFQMTLQELATAKDYGLPVKIAIINNGYLGMVRQWQNRFFPNGESETKISSPDFLKLAEAYGCAGFRVTSPDDLDETIKAAFAITDRPVLIDFQVQSKANVYPWVPADGSNKDMLTEEKP